jgi:hypothetical protein
MSSYDVTSQNRKLTHNCKQYLIAPTVMHLKQNTWMLHNCNKRIETLIWDLIWVIINAEAGAPPHFLLSKLILIKNILARFCLSYAVHFIFLLMRYAPVCLTWFSCSVISGSELLKTTHFLPIYLMKDIVLIFRTSWMCRCYNYHYYSFYICGIIIHVVIKEI